MLLYQSIANIMLMVCIMMNDLTFPTTNVFNFLSASSNWRTWRCAICWWSFQITL